MRSSKTISNIQDSVLRSFDKSIRAAQKTGSSINRLDLSGIGESKSAKSDNSYYMSGCSTSKSKREFPAMSNRFLFTGK